MAETAAWAKHAEYLSYASAEAGVAHFAASTGIDFSQYVDVIDLVIPELQRRGSYKTEYDNGTLREKLFHALAHLPQQHTGSTHR